ncbi:MAG TPA: histidine ammonia-lyase [Casimicrobiaceae bacterium]|nr:histidine ammonia-lyase [Casimicrobiaceae bacterium]
MTITLGAGPTTLDDLLAVARDREPVALAPEVAPRLAAARAVVERLAGSDTPIYGVNSALGANVGEPLDASALDAFQTSAIRARAVGVGAPYDVTSVRAMLFARIASLAVGGAGISPPVLDALVALLNARVHPRVPRYGSIGVADLPQLSHLALPLIGEGEAEVEGAFVPGAEALARAGLQPLVLHAKDALALISANSASVGRAALVLHDAHALLDQWNAAVALSYEGFRANLSPLDARVVQSRPAPGQVEIAYRLRALLSGSQLFAAGSARRVQDPLSLRCVPQVHGALWWMLGEARAQVEIELNHSGESPLVLIDDGEMLSTSNFHVPALALALDASAIALAQTAALAVERCIKFMSPAMTGLPLQLTRHGPRESGFATVQKTLTALYSDIRLRANPGSLDFLPVSERIEDHAPMTLGVVEKLADMVERAQYLVAIEYLIAAQAVDLRGLAPDALGAGARTVYRRVRGEVPALDHDRPLGPDIDRLEGLVRGREFAP